jgi:predicted RNase H-like nuclease (RuvC/YqgF family)
MGKLAKPLIIVLLLLSIASLILGIMLFSKREILKGRVEKLEQGAVQVARNIHYDDFQADLLADYEKMDAPLGLLGAQAANQYEELQNTKQDLVDTEAELNKTENELATTKAQLTQVEAQVAGLQREIEAKEIELAQVNNRVDQLEQDKSNLQSEIENLNDSLVTAEEETRDLQDEVATLEQTIAKMEVELGDRPVDDTPEGLTGEIVLVNPYWNFVVLDVGSEQGLASGAELLVHREERLVGKVRVTTVEDQMAIAEILMDWEQVPLREGDYVLN